MLLFNRCGLFDNCMTPKGVSSSYGNRPIPIVVLHVVRDSERDTGGGVAQKW